MLFPVCQQYQILYLPTFLSPVTVQCTRDAQFIVVVAKDITLPHLDLQTTSLAAGGPGCSYVDSNSAFAIYQFPVTACGTTFMVKQCVLLLFYQSGRVYL